MGRIPKRYRDGVRTAEGHALDKLMTKVEMQLEEADAKVKSAMAQRFPDAELLEAMGEMYDAAAGSSLRSKAKELRGQYGQEIARAISLEDDEEMAETIQDAQRMVARELDSLSHEATLAVVSFWAYEAYTQPGEDGAKDSIIWISDDYETHQRGDTTYRGDLRYKGTARYTLRLLQRAGMADILETEEIGDIDEIDAFFEALGFEDREERVVSAGRVEDEINPSETPEKFVRVNAEDTGYELSGLASAAMAEVSGDTLKFVSEWGHELELPITTGNAVEDGEYAVNDLGEPYHHTLLVELAG